MAKFRKGKKGKFKTLLIVFSFLMSLLTTVSVMFAITNDKKTTENVGSLDYVLGTIDENGKMVDSKKSIVMEDAETVDGLTIDIDEETATISYRVVFYGEDGEYLSTTDMLEEDYDATSAPESAETFRVVITPYQVDGEDVSISIFGISKYAKQLDVSYNK